MLSDAYHHLDMHICNSIINYWKV